jgi:hypothetical protein
MASFVKILRFNPADRVAFRLQVVTLDGKIIRGCKMSAGLACWSIIYIFDPAPCQHRIPLLRFRRLRPWAFHFSSSQMHDSFPIASATRPVEPYLPA